MSTASDTVVRHEVTVDIPPERAFAIFTEQFDQIKPHEQNLLQSPIVETVFESRVGGFVFDRAEDGSICRWARVLAFEPPERFVISWDISPTWQLESDPDRCSEVEVQFVADGASGTRVQLEHRHLDRHGDGWEGLAAGVSGANGWPIYLQRFAGLA